MSGAAAAYCPKSDEGVKSAVKPGALVVGFGKAAEKVAGQLREALQACVTTKSDDWEGSKVNHLLVVVECAPSGDCCEAAKRFMRQVRGSDGYGTYSGIIGRRVAVLGLGKMGKLAGASKVEENMLKRGGCKRLGPKIGCAAPDTADVSTLPWVREVRQALEETMDHPSPAEPAKAESAPAAPQGAPPPAEEARPPAASPTPLPPTEEAAGKPSDERSGGPTSSRDLILAALVVAAGVAALAGLLRRR